MIRYLDANGTEIIPRRGNVWAIRDTAQGMVAALQAAKRPVPAELTKLAKSR